MSNENTENSKETQTNSRKRCKAGDIAKAPMPVKKPTTPRSVKKTAAKKSAKK